MKDLNELKEPCIMTLTGSAMLRVISITEIRDDNGWNLAIPAKAGRCRPLNKRLADPILLEKEVPDSICVVYHCFLGQKRNSVKTRRTCQRAERRQGGENEFQ
jgi:hypothetical protein